MRFISSVSAMLKCFMGFFDDLENCSQLIGVWEPVFADGRLTETRLCLHTLLLLHPQPSGPNYANHSHLHSHQLGS